MDNWRQLIEDAKIDTLVEPGRCREAFKDWLVAHPDPAFLDRLAARLKNHVAPPSLQSSRFLYPGLSSRPWFDPDAPRFKRWTQRIEAAVDEVRGEVLELRRGRTGVGFQVQPERFVPRSGCWNFFYLSSWGHRFEENRRRCPVTSRLLDELAPADCAPGVAGFSALGPGSQVLPHCDPINLRVRCHLGLLVPDGDCRIRVGDRTRAWRQDGCIVFDDSFDHQTWNHSDTTRVVLAIDFWHPELAESERAFFSRAFSEVGSPLHSHLQRKAAAAEAASLGGEHQDPSWWW